MVVHELLGRGQLLNAYEAKMTHQVRTPFQFHPVPARFRPDAPSRRSHDAWLIPFRSPLTHPFPLFLPFSPAARRRVRPRYPQQGKGAEAREEAADPDRDLGGPGEGETGEEGGAQGGQGEQPDVSRTRPFPRSSRPALKRLLFFFPARARLCDAQSTDRTPSHPTRSRHDRMPRRRSVSLARSSPSPAATRR